MNVDECLDVGQGKFVMLGNVNIYWRFENVPQDEFITLTAKGGAQTNVLFQKGYWSFENISK